MSEPGTVVKNSAINYGEKRKSIKEMGAQFWRIYRGLSDSKEDMARIERAERAYQNYESNIMRSGAVPADYPYDAATYRVPRSVYMGRKNNR